MNNPIADLYAGSWEGFVSRRSEMAAAIRSSGDRLAAKAVASLRKPTRGAWLVNLLVHRESAQVAEVFELAEELGRAHRNADAAELRRLSSMRKAVIESLTKRAVALGAEQGYSASEAISQEIAETLQAAMTDPALADKILEGTLVATVRAAGFGPADVFAPSLAEVIPLRQEPSTATQSGPDPAEVRRLERERGRAEGRLEEARSRRDRAASEERHARAELEELHTEIAEVDARLAEIRQHLAVVIEEHNRMSARETEFRRILAERTAVREAADADTAKLAELVDELTRQLAGLGISD